MAYESRSLSALVNRKQPSNIQKTLVNDRIQLNITISPHFFFLVFGVFFVVWLCFCVLVFCFDVALAFLSWRILILSGSFFCMKNKMILRRIKAQFSIITTRVWILSFLENLIIHFFESFHPLFVLFFFVLFFFSKMKGFFIFLFFISFLFSKLKNFIFHLALAQT